MECFLVWWRVMIIEEAKARGYDTSKLILVDQSRHL